MLPTLQRLLREKRRQGALSGPTFPRTHVDFLFEAFVHLLQLQLVLPAQLVLVPVLFLLEQPQLSEFLAPEGEKVGHLRQKVAPKTP